MIIEDIASGRLVPVLNDWFAGLELLVARCEEVAPNSTLLCSDKGREDYPSWLTPICDALFVESCDRRHSQFQFRPWIERAFAERQIWIDRKTHPIILSDPDNYG